MSAGRSGWAPHQGYAIYAVHARLSGSACGRKWPSGGAAPGADAWLPRSQVHEPATHLPSARPTLPAWYEGCTSTSKTPGSRPRRALSERFWRLCRRACSRGQLTAARGRACRGRAAKTAGCARGIGGGGPGMRALGHCQLAAILPARTIVASCLPARLAFSTEHLEARCTCPVGVNLHKQPPSSPPQLFRPHRYLPAGRQPRQ